MEIFNEIFNEKYIGTQYEKLNHLIISSVRNQNDLGNIWPHLQSENSLHEYIKFFLIDRFNMYEELMDIFKSTDKRLISKALKCNWFFQGGNKNIICIEYFEEKLFPFISFTTKVKILHQIAIHLKDETRIKDFYQAIEKKYGFNQALILLQACPMDLITAVIEKRKKIPEKILIQIAKKNIPLSLLYYELNSPNYMSYQSVIKYIASHNIDFYLTFIMKKSSIFPSIILNHKIIKNILSKYKFQFILDNINYLHLDYRFLYKILPKSQIFQLMLAICPDKYKNFSLYYNNYSSLINMHPIEEHYKIIVNLIKAKYDMDITEFKDKINDTLIRKMPPTERQKWAELFINDEDKTGKEKYLKFCSTNVAIPQLKEMLKKATDYWERGNLIESLVETCFINKDMKFLTHIITFIEDRFRNDHLDVKIRFLGVFLQNEYISMLNDNQWEVIYKFVQILNIKSEFKYDTTTQSILLQFLLYNFENNKPIEDLLLYILKNIAVYGWYLVFGKFIIDSRLKYACLELILKKLPEIVPLNAPYWEKEDNVLELIRYIYNYNQKNPNEKVNLKDNWLYEKYQTILNENLPSSLLKIIDIYELDVKTREELNEFLLLKRTTPKLLINYIKWKPQKVIHNLDLILDNILEKSLTNYIRFFRNIRALNFLNLQNEITNKCLGILTSDIIHSDKKVKAVTLICILCTSKRINEIIHPYLPIEPTLTANEETEHYLLKKTFAKSLYKIQPVIELSVLSKYLVKDYLELAHGSLYSICLNTPEYKTKAFVMENINNRVSVKKHAFRILFFIGTKVEIYEMLENLLKKENNSSLRGIIYEMILNTFYSEPTKENFQLLDLIFDQITSNDSENVQLLLKVNKIPAPFLHDYCIKIWKILNIDYNQIDMEKIAKMKSNFINILSSKEIFSNVKSSFIMDIINHFLNLGQNIQVFSKLVIKFILNTNDSSLVEQCIGSIFGYFKQNINTNKEIHNTDREFFFRNQILIFIDCLIKKTLEIWNLNYNINDSIFDMIHGLLDEQEHPEFYYEERINIQMLKIYQINQDFYQFGQSCVPLISKHFYEYQSDLIYPLLFKIIKKFLDKMKNPSTVKFCQGLIDNNDSVPCRKLALEILSSHYCTDSEKSLYEEVKKEIFKCKNLRFYNYTFLLKKY